MEVILLERIARLGQMGDTVKVRDGFARNFLLPQGKALRANEANKKKFEGQRAQLEARNLERKTEAEAVAEKLDGKSFIVVRSAGETERQARGEVLDSAEAIYGDDINENARPESFFDPDAEIDDVEAASDGEEAAEAVSGDDDKE